MGDNPGDGFGMPPLIPLMLWVVAQVPQTPVIAPNTASRTVIGPTLALYASPPAGADGGVATDSEWRFWPTLDGGMASTGPQSRESLVYLPSFPQVTAQLAQCASISYDVRLSNSAGASAWSAPAGPVVWDAVAPPRVSSGALTPLSSSGVVNIAFTEVIDGCFPGVEYPVSWTLLG